MKRWLIVVAAACGLAACVEQASPAPSETWFEEEWQPWQEDEDGLGVESMAWGEYLLPDPTALAEDVVLYTLKEWRESDIQAQIDEYPDSDPEWVRENYAGDEHLAGRDESGVWVVEADDPSAAAQEYLMELITSFGYEAAETPEQYKSGMGNVICVTRETDEGTMLVRAEDWAERNVGYYTLTVTMETDSPGGSATLGGDVLELTTSLEIVLDNYVFNRFDKVPYPMGQGVDGQAFICSVGYTGEHQFSRVKIVYYDAAQAVIGTEETGLHPFGEEGFKLSVWTQDSNVVAKYVSILLME